MMPGGQPGYSDPSADIARLQRLQILRDQAKHRALSQEEQEALSAESPCLHCGGFHVRACPRVKRIAFGPSGNVQEVEYWASADIDWTGVLFEDVGGDEQIGPVLPLAEVAEDLGFILHCLSRPSMKNTLGRLGEAPDVAVAVHRLEALLESSQAEAVQSVHAEPPG